MIDLTFPFTSPLWKYTGKAAWYFVTLPKETAEQITFFKQGKRHGWGSIPVKVSINETTWHTSIFPDKKSDSFVLPIKKDVRQAENIKEADEVAITIELSA